MAGPERQPAGRIIHICPDAAAAGAVGAAAREAGLAYCRYEDAFAAALDVLTDPQPNTVLLLALDGLTKVELGICPWAAGRRPPPAVWAYGSSARLNGQGRMGNIRIVCPPELPKLLESLKQAWQGVAAESGPLSRPLAAPPSPTTPASAEAAGAAIADRATAAGQPDERAESRDGAPNPEESGLARPLRLQRASDLSAGPLLTEEELAALLGPGEDGHD